LTRAWTFHTGTRSGFFESGLIVIDGVMYFSAPNGVYALDAATGTQIWKYETTGTARRGPYYWPGGSGVGPRIFSQTENGLAALDPKGRQAHHELRREGIHPGLRMSSPPGGLQERPGHPGRELNRQGVGHHHRRIALGAEPESTDRRSRGGHVVRRQPEDGAAGLACGDIFPSTSNADSCSCPWKKVGNDYYGGPHHGNNLYSDCLLAVDVNTGKIKWYQQLVHHDIWDYDLAAPPALVDVQRNGRTIPGVSLITKMGIMFVFNRETGEPMYGMEERPVPQTTAKGEWTSPTQPFPIKPLPLGADVHQERRARQGHA
jgi:quinoprotein glucose dehydrogenase